MAKHNNKHKATKSKRTNKYKLLIGKYSFSKLQVLVFAVIFASVASYFLLSSKAATIYYLSPSGSDSNPCTQASPCKSFQHAYNVAAPGDTIQLAAGTYASQTMLNDSSKTSSAHVVFMPAPGASVTVGGLQFGSACCSNNDAPRHVTVQDMTFSSGGTKTGIVALSGSDDDLWQNLNAQNFYINGVTNFTIKGGDWGPSPGIDNSKIDGNSLNNNITIDGAYFHDYRVPAGSPNHFECMFIAGATNVTIRNSKFFNCDYFDIMHQPSPSQSSFSGLVEENNFFAATCSGQGETVCGRDTADWYSSRGNTWSNILIRYNSFYNSASEWDFSSGGGVGTNVREIGNIQNSSCVSGITYQYNLWQGSGCGGTGDRTFSGNYAYVNGTTTTAADYHLISSSPAIDMVTGTSTDLNIATDIDGNSRPVGAARDAGASEFGGVVTPPPPPGPTPPPPTPPPPAPPPPPPTDTTPPSVPDNLTVTGKTATSISISWTASTDNVAVAGYHLYQGSTIVGTTSSLSYSFTGLTCNTNYTNLGLTAFDAAGNESNLNQAIVITTTTNTCGPVLGDLNGDGHVTVTDLSILLSNWGSTTNATADLNNNGVVDIFDMSILLSNYGR